MSIISYTAKRLQTSANSTITPASIIVAKLISHQSTTVRVYLHDTAGTTSASTRVAELEALTTLRTDETPVPIRIGSGTLVVTPIVAAGATTAEVYVYVR